ncbi:MAG: hydroxyacid dehydrogenase [Conexivisphaera sp.]
MTARVLVTDEVDEAGLEMLRGAGLEVDYRPGIGKDELLKIVEQYHALIVRSRTKVTRDVIERGRNLVVIGRSGVGLDNIDVEAARSRGIEVVNSPEALTNSTAELALGLMLAAARKIAYAHQQLSSGKWAKEESMGYELYGKTLGIIGFGRIGRRLAELARCLGMDVIAYDIVRPPDDVVRALGVRLVSLEELFTSSDFISVHVTLTPQTRGMIGEQLLSRARRNAIIVNTSRGEVFDTAALVKALESGWIAGAALDVYDKEPPDPASKLLSLPNVVHTPHIGAQTYEAQRKSITMLAEKIISILRSKGLS